MQMPGWCLALVALLTSFPVSQAVSGRLLLGSRKKANTTRQDYSMKLVNFQNVQYFGTFTAGNQELPVIYDTGSFEVILLSTLCTDCEAGPAMYDAKSSPTFDAGDGVMAQHVFGSGPVLSKRGVETCRVGPSNSPMVATGMPFWQVVEHDIDVWHKYAEFSGIVGLGHSAHAPSMEGNSSRSSELDSQVLLERIGVSSFSICLERSTGTPPGWISFGPQVDSARASPHFRHVEVVGQIHWGVVMTSLSAGGPQWVSGSDPCNPSCAAIIDSGTSLIAAPSGVFARLSPVFDSIEKDCSNLGSLPDITFNLGAELIILPPAIYVMKVTHYVEKPQTVWESMVEPPSLIPVTECVPAFMPMDKMTTQYGPVWILGMPFLRYYYTVFERSPKAIHIAYADASCSPTGTAPSIFGFTATSDAAGSAMPVAAAAGANTTGHSTGVQAAAHSTLDRYTAHEAPAIRIPAWARKDAPSTLVL